MSKEMTFDLKTEGKKEMVGKYLEVGHSRSLEKQVSISLMEHTSKPNCEARRAIQCMWTGTLILGFRGCPEHMMVIYRPFSIGLSNGHMEYIWT